MPPRPNILVFLTDDHGHWAMGCAGRAALHTPSMDFLARTGTRCTEAFTPSPVCSPARASFFTGLLPSAHGVHDYLQEPGRGEKHPGIAGLPTLARHLHEAGYRTGLSGKWHCGNARAPACGFDTWFTSMRGTNARFGEQVFVDGETQVRAHGHQAPMYTDRALQFLGESDDRPFFLCVGYTDTHTPHTGSPERLVAAYRDADFSDVPRGAFAPVHGTARMPETEDDAARREELAQYYAAVTMIDEQVGRILDALDSKGQLDNTLVLYVADHGHMNGQHGLHSKGNATIPQNFLEESIRIPCLVRWPGHVRDGVVCDAFVDHLDLHATLLEAAGIDPHTLPDAQRRPGRSILPHLAGAPPREDRAIQFADYGNARMARSRTHKLIRRWPGPNGHFPDELYDLRQDPAETRNVIADPAQAAARDTLAQAMDTHFARFEDPERSGLRTMDQPLCNDALPWVNHPTPS